MLDHQKILYNQSVWTTADSVSGAQVTKMRKQYSIGVAFFACIITSGLLLLIATFLYLNPQVPPAAHFRDVQLQTPLRIYDNDENLIAEYGGIRRIPTPIDKIPQLYLDATLSIEDKRFYLHGGVDFISLFNVAVRYGRSGQTQGGASTITMQLARNLSLGRERTLIRKFKEILLAIKLENELSKAQILELYVNLIPFGKHAYGVGTAAYVYYDKGLEELSLAQFAMLAGIPQAPSAGNPINGPDRALRRRNLILKRMLSQRKITSTDYGAAISEPITASLYRVSSDDVNAFYIEEVRRNMLEKYGSSVYRDGYQVYTKMDSRMQRMASRSVQQGLIDYDIRHGYRGPEARLDVPKNWRQIIKQQGDEAYVLPPQWETALTDARPIAGLVPAVVTELGAKSFKAMLKDGRVVRVIRSGFVWARRYIDPNRRGRTPRNAAAVVRVGHLIRLKQHKDQWQLTQIPRAQASLVALSAKDGSVQALVGGFDFLHYQFNHAIQGKRQPGSSFKPFIYAAAFSQGLTPASIFNDAPLVFNDSLLEGKYRPRNSDGRFLGPVRLREAFYRSINLVSMRVLQHITTPVTLEYLKRFGLSTSSFPNDLQLALGGGTIGLTPMEMARAYAVFANGGHLITPYTVSRVVRENVGTIEQHVPTVVCDAVCLPADTQGPMNTRLIPAPRVLDERIAFQLKSMMMDVVRRGTGRRALALKRGDLAGKTGTTNTADTWFNGFSNNTVVSVWLGLSDNNPVGDRESGASAALPIWMKFMAAVLPKETNGAEIPPPGLVRALIDLDSGQLALPGSLNADYEWFRTEYVPEGLAERTPKAVPDSQAESTPRRPPQIDPSSIF